MTTDDETWRLAFESVFLGQLRVARAAANAMSPEPNDVAGTGGSILGMSNSPAT